MSSSALIAILVITASRLTSPSKHVLFHYPPQPLIEAPNDEEISDDSSSISSTDSSFDSSSTVSISSSKYSRLTSERFTIDDDDDHQSEFDKDGDNGDTWRRKSSRLTEWEQPLFGLSKRDLADFLIPKDSLCNRKFELGIEELVFLGHPVLLADLAAKNGFGTSPTSSIDDDSDMEAIVNKIKLTKFHVVFVMNPSWRGDYHDTVSKMYIDICKKFTDACIVEQLERGFITLEAAKIYKIVREAEKKGYHSCTLVVDDRTSYDNGMGTINCNK